MANIEQFDGYDLTLHSSVRTLRIAGSVQPWS